MPGLSELASIYPNVTFICIAVFEHASTSLENIQAFVDSMGPQMKYNVAAEVGASMTAGRLHAAGERAIPKTFVVNADGTLAWIGHPKGLGKVLKKILDKSWSSDEARAKRNLHTRLRESDDSLKRTIRSSNHLTARSDTSA